MHRINVLFLAIIQFLSLFDITKQSHVRLAKITVKAIGKTIKSPFLKQIGNYIKNSMGTFRQSKNTIKTLACSLQGKYLKNVHKFGNKSVKYLGAEGIEKFKYTAPQAVRSGKHLVSTVSKKNIYMRSVEQIRRKELGSLINMVSKSKPWLPILFVIGGFNKLTHFNLVPEDNNIGMKQDDSVDIDKVKQNKGQLNKESEETSSSLKHNPVLLSTKDKLLAYRREYYKKNRDSILKRLREYRLNNKGKISEIKKKYQSKHKDFIKERSKIYYQNNKEKYVAQTKKYHLENKDKISSKKKEWYQKNKDVIEKKSKIYRQNNKEKIKEQRNKYATENKDILIEKRRQHYLKNKDIFLKRTHQYYSQNKDKISESKRRYYEKNKEKMVKKYADYRKNNKEKVQGYVNKHRLKQKLNKKLTEKSELESHTKSTDQTNETSE